MKHTIFILFSAVLLLQGCERQEIDAYSDSDKIYFWNTDFRQPTEDSKIWTQKDSIAQSFLSVPAVDETDTVWVYVQATGYPVPYDRPVTLRQADQQGFNNAVSGKHFVPFDKVETVLPAGIMRAAVPVVLKRDESLETEEFRLRFQLVPNSYFDLGVEKYTTFIIYTSDMVAIPSNWNTLWRMAFGVWSRNKMKFLIDYVTGDIDWEASYPMGAMYSYKVRAYEKWLEYVERYGPLYDDDGEVIIFTL